MKAFITGVNGFVGSYLARALLLKGACVSGTILPGSGFLNIEKIKDQISFYDLDITKFELVSSAIKTCNPEIVFHLAGASSVGASFNNPQNCLLVNTLGTANLLEAVRQYASKAKVLLVTSGEIYGESLSKNKFTDEASKIIPLSPYGVSKAAADMLGHLYAQIYNLQVVIARPFNHIGPKQEDNFFIPTVARQIAEIKKRKTDKTLKLGNLNVYRDFTDVRDVVRAYMLLMKYGRPGEAYNICSGNLYLLKDIVKIMIELSQENIVVLLDNQRVRKIDAVFIRPKNSKIKRETGWQPEINIKQSLKDVLKYWAGIANIG